MMMSVTQVQHGGGVLLHRECCSVATVVGGTTQDLRRWRGPEGDNFQPPEILLRKNQELAATAYCVTGVRCPTSLCTMSDLSMGEPLV